jgi:glycosyltransferase involved in cell wall biosynthesis
MTLNSNIPAMATGHGKRIKVLQIQPNYHENSHDYSDLAEQIIAAFPKDKYEVTTAFLQGKPAEGAERSRAENSVYFDLPDQMLRGLRLRVRWLLFQFLRQEKFDVVIANRYKPVSIMMQLGRWLRTPVCVGISHGFGEYAPYLRRFFARRSITPAWRFVGVSPAVQRYLLAQHCGFTEHNTVAITNAFDLQTAESRQYSREEARARLELPEQSRIVGAAGRLVKVKGHVYLIRAFAKISAKHPDARLAIIGEGKEESGLRAEIAHLGMQEKVILLGFRPGAKRYVRAFDIWTMPSLSEGLGLALLEGMSGRLPIIGSDIPAMRPLIDAAGGIATPPADVDALAAALDRYLSLANSDLVGKGELAYRYLRENHSIERYRSEYLKLVEDALEKNTGRSVR